MLKLWKGIYFCFWHSDKEPVQVGGPLGGKGAERSTSMREEGGGSCCRGGGGMAGAVMVGKGEGHWTGGPVCSGLLLWLLAHIKTAAVTPSRCFIPWCVAAWQQLPFACSQLVLKPRDNGLCAPACFVRLLSSIILIITPQFSSSHVCLLLLLLLRTQADLAERLAGLIPSMQPGMAVLYWSAMLHTLRAEWFALDRHRLNKFLMLVRKFVAAVFKRLAAQDW
mgnify:CR=1 FL=1